METHPVFRRPATELRELTRLDRVTAIAGLAVGLTALSLGLAGDDITLTIIGISLLVSVGFFAIRRPAKG